jgi:branched-chain amino acid transport system substrate-binding protein
MKKIFLLLNLTLMASVSLTACARKPYTCTDPLGCVTVGNAAGIQIGSLLTMTGPDSVYGTDALRGVEIAVADKKQVSGHPVDLIKVDDLCSEEGGQNGAAELAANPDIVGVIGTSCSSASIPAAEILTKANLVLISPSSTSPSLTERATHQEGFFRTIYNDKAQGKAVAEFAFNVLGARSMLTIHDGTAYPRQLQQAACNDFEQLGGNCVGQIDLSTAGDLVTALQADRPLDPDVIYFPLYTEAGVAFMNAFPKAGFQGPALISSDGLLSADFLSQVGTETEGIYLSGPANVKDSADFTRKYRTRYGENPIASYRLQGYDAAMMLFSAIEKVAVPASSGDNGLVIPRKALRDALYATHGMQGLSGVISCASTGDCAQPNIEIFQVVDQSFKPIFP